MPQIGAHVSVAGGLVNGLIKAEALGIDTIQIFGSSPRQWQVRDLSGKDLQDYQNKQNERLVQPVFLHAPYLINLASDKKEIWDNSIMALTGHLMIADKINAQGVVFHVGSANGPKEQSLERVMRGMIQILKDFSGSTQLIIENSSSGGHKIGVSPAELGFILRGVGDSRIGFCFDTAHAFESGLFHFAPNRISRYFSDWQDKLDWSYLRLLHANDSATEFNSGHDRHANIGEGFIGYEGFQSLASIEPLNQKPWILEVPGFDGLGPDRENIDRLRQIFS
jgi:deoxyribonuclease IV